MNGPTITPDSPGVKQRRADMIQKELERIRKASGVFVALVACAAERENITEEEAAAWLVDANEEDFWGHGDPGSIAHLVNEIECAILEARPAVTACECDNTHEANDTVCQWCYAHGRRRWNDAEVSGVPQ